MTGKRILLDTSIIIDHFRQLSRENSKLSTLTEFEWVVSAICTAELWSGQSMNTPKHLNEIEAFIISIYEYNVTTEIAKKAGEIMRDTYYRVKMADALIAATAIHLQIPLATLNYKDFNLVENLQLLHV